MADDEKKPGEAKAADGAAEAAEAPKKSKRPKILIGGLVGLIGLAWAVSMVALPSAPVLKNFEGPFVVKLSEAGINVNLAGQSSKRYLAMNAEAEFDAYDDAYAYARIVDLLYQAQIGDALIRVSSQKTTEAVEDEVGKDLFAEEVRRAIDPILFPLHVGNEDSPVHAHEESGLVPGHGSMLSTMREGFYSHSLAVDADAKTIQLDDGPQVSFIGDESNLEVVDLRGRTAHVDVTGLEPGFVGDVPIGTFGRVRNVYFSKFLIQ